MNENIKAIGTLAIIVAAYFALKKIGAVNISKPYPVKGLENLEIVDRKVFIEVKKPFLFFFKKRKRYELKYFKVAEGKEKEVMEYFDFIAVKNEIFLLKEVYSTGFFNQQKKAVIQIRDENPELKYFNKIPIKYLPPQELKGIITEMYKLGIIEIVQSDFESWMEKLKLKQLRKEETENERTDKKENQ